MPSEQALIDAFLAAFPTPSARWVTLGAGDDCALVRATGTLCVTTDSVVEGVHFTRPAFTLVDVGHKALAVNLSDLAAMGAEPRWFVCALALPQSITLAQVRQLAQGMAPLARESGIALVGGNVTSAPELSVTLTVAGEVPPGKALRRDGGKPGDVLYVSGALGEARWGLWLLSQGPIAPGRKIPPPQAEAYRRQMRPTPRLKLGLLARRFATAAIDLSDGLAADLPRVCAASGRGARVRLETLPLGLGYIRPLGQHAPEYAAVGGEDYELLLAIPPTRADAFERACRRAGEQVSRIGELTRSRAVRWLDAEGGEVELPKGFEHFVGKNRRLL